MFVPITNNFVNEHKSFKTKMIANQCKEIKKEQKHKEINLRKSIFQDLEYGKDEPPKV